MNHCGTQKLETERLLLRRFAESDVDAMYQNWASDPEVTRFLTWPTHAGIEVTKQVLETWIPLYEKKDYYHWVITHKESGEEPIGSIHGLVNDDLELAFEQLCAIVRAEKQNSARYFPVVEEE